MQKKLNSAIATMTLYHTPSSYYSMIARLALYERGHPIAYQPMDIHRRQQQFAPDYVRINPSMTVPALVFADRTISDSRDILRWAFGDMPHSAEVEAWVARHYSFEIEDLTISWLLNWNPLARRMVPKQLASIHAGLLEHAAATPDLADLYRARAEVFARRRQRFDPAKTAALFETRWAQAADHLSALDTILADGRPFITGGDYTAADVVWTTFLARVWFIRRGREIERLPFLKRYDTAMRRRPSWRPADLWTSLSPVRLVRQVW